jgi:hypothetical protein
VVSIWNQRPCWRDREKTVDLKPKHDDEIILKGE